MFRKSRYAVLVSVCAAGVAAGGATSAMAATDSELACGRWVNNPDSASNVWARSGSNGCSGTTRSSLKVNLSVQPDITIASLESSGSSVNLLPYASCSNRNNQIFFGRVVAGGVGLDGRHEQEC